MPRYESPYDPSTMPKDLKHIIYEKKGHVAYVTINRPEVRGTGQVFCAGRDVKFLAQYQAQGTRTPHEDPNSPIFHWGGGGQPSDANLEKPLISAINGFAVGVGLSLTPQCQLRVMAEDAWIGDTHTGPEGWVRPTICTRLFPARSPRT